jgi:DnaJ-class molecular chaperone
MTHPAADPAPQPRPTPNVRCAGEGEYEIVRVRGTKVTWSNGGPCGWKGDRPGYWNEPCPKCGGEVELTP